MDALIFDFDGTIVDTEPLHEDAMRSALSPFGIPVREGVTIGLSDEDAVLAACSEAGATLTATQLASVIEDKIRGFTASIDVQRVEVYEGAVELLNSASTQMPVAICTAATHAEVEAIIAWLGIGTQLSALVTADLVDRQKPAPDAYLLTCERLSVSAHNALALEDSPRGVQAAVDAGLTTVAIEHTTAREHLRRAHAIVPSTRGLTLEALRDMHRQRSATAQPS